MCQRNCYCLLSVIFILLTVVSILSLVLVVQLAYISENQHLRKAECEINNCTVTTAICDDNQDCYNIFYTLKLFTNDQYYSKDMSATKDTDEFCQQNSTDCYYDDRAIASTMQIYQLYIGEWVVYIIVFSVILSIAFIIASIVMMIKWLCPCQ